MKNPESKSKCGHVGSFTGGGMNILNMGDKLLCVNTIVCGHCGSSEIVVTPLATNSQTASSVSKIVLPKK